MSWCWHKYSKWETYVHSGIAVPIGPMWGKMRGQQFNYVETRQCRRCSKCGKVQDVLIRKGG